MVVLGVMAPFLFISSARAFAIEPAIHDLSLSPGAATTTSVTVNNNESKPITFFLTVQKFIAGGNGQPKFLDPKEAEGFPSWIRVSDPEFTLAPNQKKTVDVAINIPSDAPAGGNYAAVFVTEKPVQASAVGIARRIASLFMVAVNKDQAPSRIEVVSALIQYEFKNQWYLPTNTGQVSAEVKNAGASHGAATVEAHIVSWGWTGKTTRTFNTTGRLLPNESRKFQFSWPDTSPIELINADMEIDGMHFHTQQLFVLPFGWIYIAGCVLIICIIVLIKKRIKRT